MTNLLLIINLKRYICHKTFIKMRNMEYKLRDNVTVKIEFNQAEVNIENKYKLFIIIYENSVTAKYSDVTLRIEYDNFDSEKLAKKIFTIVEQSHRISISLIKEVLELIIVDMTYNIILREINKLKEEGDINLLRKVYEFLRNNK